MICLIEPYQEFEIVKAHTLKKGEEIPLGDFLLCKECGNLHKIKKCSMEIDGEKSIEYTVECEGEIFSVGDGLHADEEIQIVKEADMPK